MMTTEPTTPTPTPATTTTLDFGPNISISNHPVLLHKMSILRSSTTTNGTFRSVLKEITYHLGYEATKTLQLRDISLSWGVPKIHVICVLASLQGLTKLHLTHPDVVVTVGMVVEEVVTDDGTSILPGLGDAGTRLYGTAPISSAVGEEDDESLLHPSKRKRSIDG